MSNDLNKAVVRRWLEELWNCGKGAIAEELFAPDYVRRDGKGDRVRGPAGVRHLLAAYRGAFPDLCFREDQLLAEGDHVAVRWTAIGTHRGAFLGFPATHRRGVLTGMDLFRLADGKIVESWPSHDQLDMLEQLGLLPPPSLQRAQVLALRGVHAVRSLATLGRRVREARARSAQGPHLRS
jgi:steroid delta-isomerase-like uncharacterized protein